MSHTRFLAPSLLAGVLALGMLAVAPGCGSDDDVEPHTPVGGADAAPAPTSPDAAPAPDAAPGETTGTLAGSVTRSVAPVNGGVGNLYIAVFDRDPVASIGEELVPVARAQIDGADLSADGASVAYEVPDIPPSDTPYFVSAFLDDNGTVDANDPSSAGPDRGDLVSLEGIASPSVVVDRVGTIAFDIDLNLAMPF